MANANNRSFFDNESINFSFVSTHSLSINYQVGRKAVIGATLGYSMTGVNFNRSYLVYDNTVTEPGTFTEYTSYRTAFHQLRVFNYELNYTGFSKSIAPVGTYWSIYGGLRNTRIRGGQLTVESGDKQIQFNTPSKMGFYAGVELGKQRVLFDKLTLRYGIKFDILGTFTKYAFDFFVSDSPNSSSRYGFDSPTTYIFPERERFIKDMSVYAKDRAGMQHTILFHVSIGVLAS